MNAAMFIVMCFLCFLGGFILNEVLRTKKEDKEKYHLRKQNDRE